MTETPPPYVTGARVYPVKEIFCECGDLIGTQTTGPDGKPVLVWHGRKFMQFDCICSCGREYYWRRSQVMMDRIMHKE